MNFASVQNDYLSATLGGARGLSALDTSTQAVSGGNEAFREIMAQAFNTIAKPQAAGDDAIEMKAREAATQFVATAFLMPVMESMHESPFAAEPFAPSSAEKRFAPMLDWQFADRIASAQKFPLVDAIVDRIMQHVADANGKPRDVETATRAVKGSLDVRG